jgi:hypothetical protein
VIATSTHPLKVSACRDPFALLGVPLLIIET